MDDGPGRIIDDLELGAWLEAVPMDVAKADHSRSGGCANRRGDESDPLAIVPQLGVARRLRRPETQPDELAVDVTPECRPGDDLLPDVAAFFIADRPLEIGFQRNRLLVHVLGESGKPGLDAQDLEGVETGKPQTQRLAGVQRSSERAGEVLARN